MEDIINAESHDGVHIISFERHSYSKSYGETCSSDAATHFPCCHNNAESRSAERSLQCGDPLTMVDGIGRGSVAGAKTCRSGFSLSFAPFREVEDVVAYAMANSSSSDQIIRAARVGRAWPSRGDRPFDCGVNNLLCFSHTMFGTLKNVRTFLYQLP